jgi:peptide/nickel transport system permease protein
MINFIVRRFLHIIPLFFMISIVVFAIINLPPGDYLTVRVAELERQGNQNAERQLEGLRDRYGLDRPIHVQYWIWITHFVIGDFGESFDYSRPVNELIGDYILLTAILALCTLVFSWVVAIPIGVYCAVRQYSIGDQLFSMLSFIGLGTPGFLLALILMVLGVYAFDVTIGGLFSPEFVDAPWSVARVLDLMAHLWLPVILLGIAGTAELIRIMRGNLLDILGQQYVRSARGRGLSEQVVIWKHAVRMAINPLISLIGLQFPQIISGSIIISIVMGLPTTGPFLLRALRAQDMYYAGSFLMLLSLLLMAGNFVADLLLAWVDPRISYERM